MLELAGLVLAGSEFCTESVNIDKSSDSEGNRQKVGDLKT